MLEVDLVVLDPADRKAEIDLERAELRVSLVGACGFDALQLPQDLVSLVDVALV
jgi:hypothetical protein